ncbi:MAG TPA: 5'-3' exonuclease H3TH domain-containing protein [Steroidobacteraceae bacterium]|nr:5'-3' exonuclease H3TH domain-containing protein [Steroidobacteraceae bacterium]
MIFLVDASVYVFRAYHSQLPPMVDGEGNPVHAVYGFARFLGDLIERIRPRYIGVAFDQRLATSYRNRIYPAYKANREPAPAGLPRQFEYCRELCRHLGVPAFVNPEFEADDIIGTLSCLMRAEGIRSAFITRDKDMAQLVRDGDLLWDFGSRTQIGYRDVQRYFGVAPEGFADFLALTGDASDNIPGVPGIGPKIAATLLRKFGSLDALYDNIGRVAALGLRGGSALGERLAAHRESVFLARRLTRIVCDMSLGVSASDLRPRTPDLAALGAFYDRLGFGPLLRRQGERLAGQCCERAVAASG